MGGKYIVVGAGIMGVITGSVLLQDSRARLKQQAVIIDFIVKVERSQT
jgi:hypothetical protein